MTVPQSYNSMDRFIRAASFANEYKENGSIAESFQTITGERNLELLQTSMDQTTRIDFVPEKMLIQLAGYPFTLECKSEIQLTKL